MNDHVIAALESQVGCYRRLAKLAVESLRAGRRVYCLDLPENGDLRVAGAVACETAELARLAAKVGIVP